ncbi:MAG TPA: molybdenum ABC transporter ATP-binding protein [Geminicoccaceae bacterium]
MLEVDIALPLGGFALDARFATGRGITALFGRSGSGKTTVINCVAGLLRPRRGRIVADGRVLFDSEAGVDVPRHRRRVGYVFQDARLFPHLSVRQNLLYGQRFAARGDEGHGPAATLEAVVDLLGVGHLLARRPGALSGGERQRVAIGRALLANPRLLLMDEPLASLDAPRKAEILPYLERLRDALRVPVVYVSHSLEEVTRLADSVVAMAEGRVVAAGHAAEVLSSPEFEPVIGRFEAGSLLTARVKGEVEAYALTLLDHPAGELRVPRLGLPAGTAVRLRVRARDVALAASWDELAGLSTRNRLRARVVAVRPSEDALADVTLDVAGEALAARVTREAVAELGLVPGREVTALIKTVAIGRRGVGLVEAGGG